MRTHEVILESRCPW